MLQRMQKPVGYPTLKGEIPVITEIFVDCVFHFHREGSISTLKRGIPAFVPGVSEHKKAFE